MPAPRPRRIADFKPTLTNLAQTAHYEVTFSGLGASLRSHLQRRGIYQFTIGDIGLLCHSATLPGSSFATTEVYGDYMGLTESMPHTRTYVPLDLSFYVDRSYNSIKLFEHWMEFMNDASDVSRLQPRPHFRMQYPDEYKCDRTKIVKFERDYNRYIEYTFFGLYPKTLNATSVSYDKSELLKIGVSFSYDYYVSGKVDSKSIGQGTDNNLYGEYNIDGINASAPIWKKSGTEPNSYPFSTDAFGEKTFVNPDAYKNTTLGSSIYSQEIIPFN